MLCQLSSISAGISPHCQSDCVSSHWYWAAQQSKQIQSLTPGLAWLIFVIVLFEVMRNHCRNHCRQCDCRLSNFEVGTTLLDSLSTSTKITGNNCWFHTAHMPPSSNKDWLQSVLSSRWITVEWNDPLSWNQSDKQYQSAHDADFQAIRSCDTELAFGPGGLYEISRIRMLSDY